MLKILVVLSGIGITCIGCYIMIIENKFIDGVILNSYGLLLMNSTGVNK